MGKAESKGWEGVDSDPDVEATPEMPRKHLVIHASDDDVVYDNDDPRSPTNAIARTPLRKAPPDPLDPRSPNDDIARTPFEGKRVVDVTDPREPTEGIERTPLLPEPPTNFFFQSDLLDPIGEESKREKEEGKESMGEREAEEAGEGEEEVRFVASSSSFPGEKSPDASFALENVAFGAGGKKKRMKSMSQSPRRSSYSALGSFEEDEAPSPGTLQRKSLPVINSGSVGRKKTWYGKLDQTDEVESELQSFNAMHSDSERIALNDCNFDHVISNSAGYQKIISSGFEDEENSALVPV